MFFDALAVLLITFFASLGMVEAAEWLVKFPIKRKIRRRVFVVAKIGSAPEEDIEPALRSILAETNGMKRSVLIDCEGISDSALRICQRLERRFDCSLFRGEDELLSMISDSLHTDEKTL